MPFTSVGLLESRRSIAVFCCCEYTKTAAARMQATTATAIAIVVALPPLPADALLPAAPLVPPRLPAAPTEGVDEGLGVMLGLEPVERLAVGVGVWLGVGEGERLVDAEGTEEEEAVPPVRVPLGVGVGEAVAEGAPGAADDEAVALGAPAMPLPLRRIWMAAPVRERLFVHALPQGLPVTPN